MQLNFFREMVEYPAKEEFLLVGGRHIPLAVVRNPRAQRYVLRLRHDGRARVTIPRGGSAAEARRFVARNQAWLERQLLRLASRPVQRSGWHIGSEILFRGQLSKIEQIESGGIRFATEALCVTDPAQDLRPVIERYLWRLARNELPPRVLELATQNQLTIQRVSVRNQRSRWGSCSRKAVISLNWRLIQAPPFVSDYIVLHELMHLRQMNHSERFWHEVAGVCPDFRTGEKWLKQNSDLLRS